MLKFLLIVGLVLYTIYKIGSLFFRAGAATQQFRNQQAKNGFDGQRPADRSKKSNFKGGEYVDYEDIK